MTVKMRASKYRRLWIGIGILTLLAPVGLILPELFKAGGAWGEWSAEDIKRIAGYIPDGFKRLSGKWVAPISDYAFPGWYKGMKGYFSYALSGLIGVTIVAGIAYLFGRLIRRK